MAGYCVYILKSKKDGWTYTGHTNNIERRLREHNLGKVKATKGHIPFELLYTKEYVSRGEAMRGERFLKSGLGRRERRRIETSQR